MDYKITLRISSDNLDYIKKIKGNSEDGKIFYKGISVRQNSDFKARTNILIYDLLNLANCKENINDLIINKLESINTFGLEVKKELIISCVTSDEQFGVEISTQLLMYLSTNNFSLNISGIYL